MGAASHLPSQINPDYNGLKLFAFTAAILGVLEFNAIKGKTDNLKITSIMGVTHMGLILTAILYIGIEVLTK
jgi:FtsH-binding integral membrane protein